MTAYLASDCQAFEITIGAGQTSNTATINAVGSLAFILPGGQTSNGTAANESFARVTLTNSTTVTATRNSSDASLVCVVRGTVIDASSELVVSVEYGSITLTAATSNTATLSTPVTATDSAVIWLGTTTTAAAVNMSTALASVTLTDTDTVTVTGGASQSTTTSFCVVQFQNAVLQQDTQPVVFTSTSNTTGGTSTITAVTMANTMLFYGGYNSGLGSMASIMRNELTATTTVTHTRAGTNTTSRTTKCTVVEFISGVLTSNQRGNTPVSGATTADENVTAITLANGVCNWVCFSTAATTTPAEGLTSAKMLDADTVQSAKLSATADSTTSWEAVEFDRTAAGGNTVSETSTVTDTYAVSRAGTVTRVETVTPSESSRVTRSASVTVAETTTPSDSYDSNVLYTRTLTETITPSDTSTVTRIGVASRSETATVTDANVSARSASVNISENSTLTDNLNGACVSSHPIQETCTASDTTAGLATGNIATSETTTVTDSYEAQSGTVYEDAFTETVTASDSYEITATCSAQADETVAANDNYECSQNVVPDGDVVTETGPSDGKWDNYLKWLKKKKLKQFKKLAAQNGIPQQKVDRIVAAAAVEVLEELPKFSPVTVDYVADEELARNIAQKTILAIYDRVWQEQITQIPQIEDDNDDDLYMMMM